jgi:hypothetical protein
MDFCVIKITVNFKGVRACSTNWREDDCIKYLVGKSEGKRSLRRPGYRWDDNITIYFREIGLVCGLDSSGSGYGSVACSVNTVMNLRIS